LTRRYDSRIQELGWRSCGTVIGTEVGAEVALNTMLRTIPAPGVVFITFDLPLLASLAACFALGMRSSRRHIAIILEKGLDGGRAALGEQAAFLFKSISKWYLEHSK
jgi:hypothetical protein